MVNEYQLVATLVNGKKVLLEPNYSSKKCAYRYLTQYELDNQTLDITGDVTGKHIWLETPIFGITENGILHIGCTIEVTPIVLKRI